jgi:hypothetical protein
VSVVCCQVRGLCDGLITRPEESYQLWRVVVCDQEISKKRRLKPATGLWKIQPQWGVTPRKQQQKIPKWRGSRHFGKITGQHSRPQFHLPPLGSLASWRTWGHLMAKVGTSKRGEKQWQTTPKNLPRMQRTRAIPVA